jgi:hypothetical protein
MWKRIFLKKALQKEEIRVVSSTSFEDEFRINFSHPLHVEIFLRMFSLILKMCFALCVDALNLSRQKSSNAFFPTTNKIHLMSLRIYGIRKVVRKKFIHLFISEKVAKASQINARIYLYTFFALLSSPFFSPSFQIYSAWSSVNTFPAALYNNISQFKRRCFLNVSFFPRMKFSQNEHKFETHNFSDKFTFIDNEILELSLRSIIKKSCFATLSLQLFFFLGKSRMFEFSSPEDYEKIKSRRKKNKLGLWERFLH